MTDPVSVADPDSDPMVSGRRGGSTTWPVLGVIAAGGAIGALTRYGITIAWPHKTGGFAWATLVINTTGCLLIGGLMVLVEQVWVARPLARPFLGVGVLGGYTTFSTYAVDLQQMFTARAVWPAIGYLTGTALTALIAVSTGVALAGRVVRTHAGTEGAQEMEPDGVALRLTIYVGEDDLWHHKPLYTEIVHRAHAAGLAGASVFRGVEGYGASNHIHTTRILSLSGDLPVGIVIVDAEERIRAFLPQLDEVITNGLVYLEPVEVIHRTGGHPR